MTMLPRLLDGSMEEKARLHPLSATLALNLAPLSNATLTLPEGENDVLPGDYIELYTPYGSAGVFRCVQAESSYSGTTILTLDHGLASLRDRLIPGATEEDITSSPQEALQTILGYQTMWQLGSVDIPGDEIITWAYDHTNLYGALCDILERYPDYMAVTHQEQLPWTLDIVRMTDKIGSECRLTRNVSSLNVSTDRSDLITRLYVYGRDTPMDADTIDQYGVVERYMDGDDDISAEDLEKEASRELALNKHPALTVSVSAIDLSHATGESLDHFQLGDICRVCLPDYGQTINQRVIALEWIDLYGEPESVNVTLASKAKTTGSAVKGLTVETTTLRNKLFQQSRNVSVIAQSILLQADAIALLGNAIDVHAADILSLRSGMEDNAAAIVLANGRIEAQANEIALKADKIELEGLVTATELEVVRADITNLTAGVTTAATLKANVLHADSTLIVGGEIMGKRQITMGDVATVGSALSTDSMDLQHSHAVSVDSSGKLQLGGVTTEGNGGNFNIADTQFYKDGVSAAINSVTVYSPFVTSTEHPGESSQLMRVYMQAKASNGAASDIVSELISAAPVYNVGWNDCLKNCTGTIQLYDISDAAYQNVPLFTSNGQGVGTGFVRVRAVSGTYFIPDPK